MTQVCKQRYEVATVGRLFPSGSSDKVYKVTAFRPDQFPFCNCMGYIMRRKKQSTAEGCHPNEIPGSCKHTDQMFAETCDWRQESDGDYRYDGMCPKCAGPLVEEGDLSLPDDPASAVDDLRAVLADLRGEEAPAPLPKAEPYVVEFTTLVTQTRRITVEALDDGSGAQVTEAWKQALDRGDSSELVSEREASAIDKMWKQADAPKVKKPRKAAAKKAAASDRTRKADVASLVKGAQK